jgi:GNAT superfamily N-acetyltransferase
MGPYADSEWDLDNVPAAYQRGGGGFWIAWIGEEPAGHIGAQSLGGVAELRRMFVVPNRRRLGIGTQLVYMLIARCRSARLHAVECWTAEDGPGRELYSQCGFRVVAEPGPGYGLVDERTWRRPHENEIRMRIDLHPGRSEE